MLFVLLGLSFEANEQEISCMQKYRAKLLK